MFCPQCGQRQVANDARFCSSCGLPLNVVAEVVAGGGQFRLPLLPESERRISPRQKGIRQGAMLMLSVTLVVPLVIFLGVALLGLPGELIPLVATLCVMGGLLRILYAVLFEDGGQPGARHAPPPPYVRTGAPHYLGTPDRHEALPPPPTYPTAYRPPRFNTGELVPRPPSVTENTTQILDRHPEEPPAQQ